MEVTLKIKDNLYRESPDGKRKKIIKRNAVSNITLDTSDIMATSDLLNTKGNILKNYCRLHIKEIGPVIVNHSREQINKLKQNNARPIGFKQQSKQGDKL